MKASTVISILLAVVLISIGLIGVLDTYTTGVLAFFNKGSFYGWASVSFPLLIVIGWCLLSALNDTK